MVVAAAEEFPKSARLLKASDFKFLSCRRFDTRLFCFYHSASGEGRLGVSIPKKVLKHATARNRVRRLAREAFRKQRAGLMGVDVNLVGKAALRDHWETLGESDLAAEFERFSRFVSRSREKGDQRNASEMG